MYKKEAFPILDPDQRASEMIHLISIYPLLYQESKDEVKKILAYFGLNYLINDKFVDYLMYCLDAYTPEDRNYEHLYKALNANTLDNKGIIKKAMIEALKIGNHYPTIKRIYDIGAGHDGYSDILKEIYPKAKVTLIDKNEIKNSKYKTRKIKAKDFFKKLKGDKYTLIFFSEFLHCKENLKEFLVNKNASKCCILINELLNNNYIKYRIQQTDGDILKTSEIVGYLKLNTNDSDVCINHSRYSNMFDYYMVSYYPIKHCREKKVKIKKKGVIKRHVEV